MTFCQAFLAFSCFSDFFSFRNDAKSGESLPFCLWLPFFLSILAVVVLRSFERVGSLSANTGCIFPLPLANLIRRAGSRRLPHAPADAEGNEDADTDGDGKEGL